MSQPTLPFPPTRTIDPFVRYYDPARGGTVLDVDPRFIVVGHDWHRPKNVTYEVYCAACKIRLVVGGRKDPTPGIALALENNAAAVRACCPAGLRAAIGERNVGGGEGDEPEAHPPEGVLGVGGAEPAEGENRPEQEQDDGGDE